jgi:hypothetical protein
MAIFDLFSKRQKRLRGEMPDVYVYDEMPNKLRVQIVHIIKDAIGTEMVYNDHANNVYQSIHDILCREYGRFALKTRANSNFSAVYDFFLATEDVEECLDIIELSFKHIDAIVRKAMWEFKQTQGFKQDPDSAINELNERFKESGIGYQFESGELIRVDSQFIHSEAIKPTLRLLASEKRFTGTNSEFLCAHEHYRHGRNKEALVECLKSFESLMKAICEKQKWSYEKTDTAKNLINVCFQNGLIPPYLQTQFSSLKALLESGVPTTRNKEGGHGQGVDVKNVPDHLAAYVIHLTATNLLFLANCEMNIK